MMRGLARLLLGAFSLVGLGTFVGLAVQRVPYPLELDCIEGVMLDHITRLAQGQPIYVEPTLRFIPLAYMPGFAAASSLITRLAGEPAFWQPRVLSFISTLVLLGLIAFLVQRETGRRSFALGAAGLFALGFGFTGGCYDVARPDSLMLVLSLAGLAVLRHLRGRAGAIVAALLMTAAFFTKQHAIWFIFGAMAHLAQTDRRRLVSFGVTALAGCLGGYLLLTAWLGEWFRVFTWSIPRGWSELDRGRIQYYLGHGIFGALGAFSIPLLITLGSARRPWRGPVGLWLWTAAAAVATGLMATLDSNAYRHLFTPTLLAFCIAGPIALQVLAETLREAGREDRAWGDTAAMLVFAVAFVPLFYPTHTQLPHPRALEAHHELMARLQLLPGDVLMPYHGWYAHHSGHSTSLHIIALDDIERSRGNAILRRDPEFLRRMFAPLREGPHRPTIVTDRPLASSGDLWRDIEPGYRLADSLGWITDALRPVTGNQFGPSLVFEPRPSSAAPGDGAMSRARIPRP